MLVGTGISPDDQRNNINYAINTDLMTYKPAAAWQTDFRVWQNILVVVGTWYYEEYSEKYLQPV